MANTVEFLDDRFIAISGIGKIQADKDTPLADADIDTRLKCTVALEGNVQRQIKRNCEDTDRTSEKVQTRYRRLRLTFSSITAQLYAVFFAWYLGVASAPTGSAQNEIQTLTRSGTVSGGTFTLALTLEGRTATTKPLAYDATATEIEEALTAARMKWIQPGDVSVSGGTKQVETATAAGNISSSGDLSVTVTAAGMPNSPKVVSVAVVDTDDDGSAIAAKIRAALIADADVGHPTTGFFVVTGATDQIVLTAKAAAANDATMNVAIADGTSVGVTPAATSANTTAGVSAEDWGGLGMVVTFQNRLGNTNLDLMVVDDALITGGGSIEIAQTQAGSNYYHEFTRSTSRQKVHTGFALGRKDGSRDPEKFSGFAVETFQPGANRRQDAALVVTLVGPYEGEEMTGYVVPDCENPTALESSDCKVLINANWETTDVSTLSAPFNDNIALDESAYGFDGIDPDLFARAKQVDYDVTAQIFSVEDDPIALLAKQERPSAQVDAKFHFGMPGDRFTILAPETEVKFQDGEHFVPVGATERMAGNYRLAACQDDQDPPISGEAYINQSQAFLQVSP